MLSCFAGCGICGFGGAQDRQAPDKASKSKNLKLNSVGEAAASNAPEASSTPKGETTPVRKRDVIRQKLFGGAHSESGQEQASFTSKISNASTATRMRKRDWIQMKLGIKTQADVLEQDVQ
eukprot:TRINITY_DN1956_c0_g1_i2.p1 TRINITY_DN1956_c0_g1~~TRINITY_DN1956_c0_g1_i2.p1  ORF type:complete len:121 (-),score=27.21 TRINITY_DN1956_c0_g1_i2:295-657(-)